MRNGLRIMSGRKSIEAPDGGATTRGLDQKGVVHARREHNTEQSLDDAQPPASTFLRTDLLWARARYLQALANAVQVYVRPCCWQVSLTSPIFTLSPPPPFRLIFHCSLRHKRCKAL
jgi:hypothetical protein